MASYLTVPCPELGVLLVEYSELDSLGDAVILWGAMLGSTVDTCSDWVLLGEYRIGSFTFTRRNARLDCGYLF